MGDIPNRERDMAFHIRATAALLAALVQFTPALVAPAQSQTFQSEATPLSVETVAAGLDHPWGLAFLPGGGYLVTERPGRMRAVSAEGKLSPPIHGVPAVATGGQGGLLDVALSPDFASTRLVFWTFSEPRDGGNGTSVARGRLSEDLTRLDDVKVIFRQMPTWKSSMHFGSRIAFAPDGNLFVTLGERFVAREKAQDLGTHLGKIVRIRPDGTAPPDNPFVGKAGALPEIWTYGHRNPQGLVIHPQTGRLWEIEHGARGGDEINLPQPGRNYGWPVISYGGNYDGTKIGEGTSKPGMEQPIYFWDPSIAPSGAAFVTSDRFPKWQGNLLVGALAGQMLVRLEIAGEEVRREERLLRGLNERIRDVRQGPDGYIYLLTDNPKGRILRLKPGA
jgi:glucose/arabinose dehydrogenase